MNSISIKQENEYLKKLIVKKIFNGIKYIENQTDELKFFAIEQTYNQDPRDFCVLKYIKNPTEEMIKLAIDKNYENVVYVNNLSVDIQMYLVKKNPNYIGYIKNPNSKVSDYCFGKTNKKEFNRNVTNYNQLMKFLHEDSEDSEDSDYSETIDSLDSF